MEPVPSGHVRGLRLVEPGLAAVEALEALGPVRVGVAERGAPRAEERAGVREPAVRAVDDLHEAVRHRHELVERPSVAHRPRHDHDRRDREHERAHRDAPTDRGIAQPPHERHDQEHGEDDRLRPRQRRHAEDDTERDEAEEVRPVGAGVGEEQRGRDEEDEERLAHERRFREEQHRVQRAEHPRDHADRRSAGPPAEVRDEHDRAASDHAHDQALSFHGCESRAGRRARGRTGSPAGTRRWRPPGRTWRGRTGGCSRGRRPGCWRAGGTRSASPTSGTCGSTSRITSTRTTSAARPTRSAQRQKPGDRVTG